MSNIKELGDQKSNIRSTLSFIAIDYYFRKEKYPYTHRFSNSSICLHFYTELFFSKRLKQSKNGHDQTFLCTTFVPILIPFFLNSLACVLVIAFLWLGEAFCFILLCFVFSSQLFVGLPATVDVVHNVLYFCVIF